MSRKRIERRLVRIGEDLRTLRAEAAAEGVQLEQLLDEAEDTRLRALVADSPLARHEHHDAQAWADTLQGRQTRVLAKIAELEARQDQLLEELTALHG